CRGLAWSLTRLQRGHGLGDPFCTCLGPFCAIDPADEVLAIEGGQGLEEAARGRRGVLSCSNDFGHGAQLRTFGCEHNHDLSSDTDGCFAPPRRPELEDVSARPRRQLAANFCAC